MAVYAYSENRIESIIRATKQLRLRYCVVATGILGAACVVAFTRPEWIFGPGQQARLWVVLALAIFVAGPLADTLWRWKSRPEKLRKLLQSTRITVDEQGIELADANSIRRFMRSDILRAEEVCWGIYLRSANRYRWILVSSKMEQFSEFKAEVRTLGIPITAAGIPPNCEELVGALAFVATMLCAVFSRSAEVLTADLVISVVVAGIGFAVVSANPENSAKMRLARFGIFLPVAMTGTMLWTALR